MSALVVVVAAVLLTGLLAEQGGQVAEDKLREASAAIARLVRS